MRIMITGGTGFIGYHTTVALLEAGHEVVLLVRSESKMRQLYGKRITHFVVGDITDEASVKSAMHNCDAVISIAALVSTNANDAERVLNTNLKATQLVIGGAVELGVSSIIHVSSVTALYNKNATLLDESSPVGNATTSYGSSKVACEKYVRELQDKGAPIYITYPTSVIGPDSPTLTEPHDGIMTFLGSVAPVMPSGNQYVDVRDIAQVHKSLIEKKPPPGRYPLGGHYLTWGEHVELCNSLTGRNIMKVYAPGNVIRLIGSAIDFIGRFMEVDFPLNYEAAQYATAWVKMDSSKVEKTLGITFRPVEESFKDSILWLHQENHLSSKQIGTLIS